MKQSYTYLSGEETDYLKKQVRKTSILSFLIGFASSFLLYILYISGNQRISETILLLIILVILLASLVIPRFMNRELKEDILSGSKMIVSYLIDSKGFLEEDNRGRGRATLRYYVMAEGKQITIDKSQFEMAEKGDTVIVHATAKAAEELKVEIVITGNLINNQNL
jgi:hypothetical protein